MAFFKNPSEMHLYRANQVKKWADSYYARAIQAENEGDMDKYYRYRAKANKYYNQVKEYKMRAWLDQGKPFEKKHKTQGNTNEEAL